MTRAGTIRTLRSGAGALVLSGLLASAMVSSADAANAEPGHIPDQKAANGEVVADRSGECSAPSRWRLIIRKVDAATFGLAYKVRGGASGQQWSIFMEDKGTNFFNGSRVSGDDGFFRVATSAKNLDGTDKFLVGANNSVTGEICRSRASV